MKKLQFDYSHASISDDELDLKLRQVKAARSLLESGAGPGRGFQGWLRLPERQNTATLTKVKSSAAQIRKQSDLVIIIGIGGSYLGARAAMGFLNHAYYNDLPPEKRNGPAVYFAGTNLSGTQLTQLMDIMEGRDFSLIVISKSGTTTEPAIAFRILKEKTVEKYGKDGAKERIFAITDKAKGALKLLADREDYTTFEVPDDIGGRYSVLTPVGLLPIAVAGIDIGDLLAGANAAMSDFEKDETTLIDQYAACRNILYQSGKLIELLVNYEPGFHFVAEWWKQLFGESEGKNGKGIFPATANFTTDLHSLGQYIQDGRRHLFETVLVLEKPEKTIALEKDPQNLDGLNYLSGRTMDFVNKMAVKGTLEAHTEGGVPNLILTMPEASPWHLGYLFYFFEKACAVSGYTLGVNPFDQPGVESYKKNMFRLLGKG